MSKGSVVAPAASETLDRILIASAYGYLVLPTIIFLFGWLKTPLAIVAAAIVLTGTIKALVNFGYFAQPELGRIGFLTLCLVGISAWVLLSGIDSFGYQNPDFDARNAIFRDLVREPWPVLYDYRGFPGPQSSFGDTGALVYYFGFWLPPALVGKALGWAAANHALLLWTILGVFLTVLLLCRFSGVPLPLLVIGLAAWSGMDIVGSLLYVPPASLLNGLNLGAIPWRAVVGETLVRVFGTQELEGWAFDTARVYVWHYPSFTTQLFWAFNQSVPAWIATALLLNQRDRKSMVFTYSLAVLLAPFPAVGLFPFLVYKLLQDFEVTPGASLRRLIGDFWAQSASVQNIVTPLSLIFIAGAFFGAQRSPPVHGFVWDFLPPSADGALRYLAFCMLEFGAVGILLLIQKPHRGMVALAMGVLLLLPLYRYGTDSVFSGRASIPALLVLCIVSIRAVFTPPASPLSSEFARSLLIAALLVGCITPLHEIGRSTSAIVNSGGMPPPTDRWITFNGRRSRPPPDMGQLVAPQADTTFFFRILAREN